MSEGTNQNGGGMLSAEQLADKTRFRFRESVLDLTDTIGGKITLKSLSVREREELPDAVDLTEVTDTGERTQKAISSAAQVFAVIVSEPKVTVEQAEQFLGDWPAEAFDAVTAAYGQMVGNREEAKAAAGEFPATD
jgi:hypothetical protein